MVVMAGLLMLGTAGRLPSLQAAEPGKPAASDSEMETWFFQVPPDFLSISAVPQVSTNPLSYRPSERRTALQRWHAFTSPKQPQSVKSVLAQQGISFPPGAEAMLYSDEVLVVTNTRENLHLVDAFATWGGHGRMMTLAFTAHVVKAPGPLLRLLAANAALEADQAPDLQRLMEEAETGKSNVKILHTGFVETWGGYRCTLGSVTEHQYTASLQLNKEGRAQTEGTLERLGFEMELDPTINAYGETADVNVGIRLAQLGESSRQLQVTEPISGNPLSLALPVFQKAEVLRAIRLRDGHTRLLGMWRAKDAPANELDLHQGVFLTLRMVRQGRAMPAARVYPITKTAQEEKTLDLPPEFLMVNPDATDANLVDLLSRNGLPLPAGSEARLQTEGGQPRLILKAPPASQIRAKLWTERYAHVFPRSCQFEVEVIRAPAPLLRRQLQDVAGQMNHQPALMALRAAVQRGEARRMALASHAAALNRRSSFESYVDRHTVTDLDWQSGQQAACLTERRAYGLTLDVDPYVRDDPSFVEVSCGLYYHTAPPTPWRERITDPATRQAFERPVDAFHLADVSCRSTFQEGRPKIIGVWRPVGAGGKAGDDVLEAAFMTCHVIRHVTHFQPPSAAEAGIQPESESKVDPAEMPAEMMTRIFDVKPGFPHVAAPLPTADPFVAGSVPEAPRGSVEDLMKAEGIAFPPGAAVITRNAVAGQLIVRNTEANLARVEAFVEKYNTSRERRVGVTLHLFEAPAALVEKVLAEEGHKDDHLPLLNSWLGQAPSGVRPLVTMSGQVWPGEHGLKLQQVQPERVLENIRVGAKGAELNWNQVDVGTRMDLKAEADDDGAMIELSYDLDHHPAGPASRKENLAVPGAPPAEIELTDFQREKIQGELTLMNGTARILAVWSPPKAVKGVSEDHAGPVLHLAILKADVLADE